MEISSYSISNDALYYTDSEGQTVRVAPITSRMAVVYDEIDGVLHKHGDERLVSAWYEDTVAKLNKAGFTNLVEALVMVVMPIDQECVREVNRCIAVTGSVVGLAERVEARSGIVIERAFQ